MLGDFRGWKNGMNAIQHAMCEVYEVCWLGVICSADEVVNEDIYNIHRF